MYYFLRVSYLYDSKNNNAPIYSILFINLIGVVIFLYIKKGGWKYETKRDIKKN